MCDLMEERPDQYVDFISDVEGIVAIKRLRITDQTKAEEIGLILSGVRRIAEKGICIELEIDADALDSAAKRISDSLQSGEIETVDSKLLVDAVRGHVSATKGKETEREAIRYLVSSIFLNLKMPASVTEAELVKVYPELKKMVKIKSKKSGGKKRKREEE